MKKLLAVTFVIAASAQAHAGYLTGNDLHEWCSGSTTTKTGAMAYALGVYDAIELSSLIKDSPVPKMCVPNAVTRGQVGDVVCAFVADNAAQRHYEASALVWNSIVDAWPCNAD